MRYLSSVLVIALALLAPASARSTSPGTSFPASTGAGYPFGRHLAIMLVHMDGTGLAMAEDAQQHASSDVVKRLAAEIGAQRSKEIASGEKAYRKQYGQTMPAWMGSGMAGSSGMAGGGMMGGGTGMAGGGMTGQMMSYGDGYQMMMGDGANWWGSSNVDSGFVPAIMRLDAMQVSMATLGVHSSDVQTARLCSTIVSSRTAELSRLAKML